MTERLQLLLLAALLGAGCASQVPPPGGPPDTEPPGIVSTVPAEGELHFRGDRIVVRFSEYVDRRSLQESVFLSPSAGALTFDWSSSEVSISPAETLKEATTFILTIGTDLRDTRNNRLAGSFTLAFSTGDVIDSGAVSGRVYDEAPGGVMIYAYSLPGAGPDTLNPAVTEPDYLTQTGADGSYRLTHMKYGRYRLMAVRDVFKNLLYNIQTDRFGMPAGDLRLDPSKREIAGVVFTLSVEDTVRPYVTAARGIDRERAIVRFNEKPLRTGLRDAISVTDTLSGAGLEVIDFSPADTAGREFTLLTAPQDSGRVYRVRFSRLEDAAGNTADSSGTATTFTGVPGVDTLIASMTMNLRNDSTTGVLPGAGLTLTFSRAVDTSRFAAGFSVTRIPGEVVPGRLTWEGSFFARFTPAAEAEPGAWYEVRVAAGSVRDLRGNAPADSAFARRYRIIEEKFLGSIGGRVAPPEGGDSLLDASSVVVVSRDLSGSGGETRVRAEGGGSFLIDHLPEGRYSVYGFVDADGDGKFDHGAPYPPRYAEPFSVYPDTLKIRPGWPVSGVRLELGK